MTWVSHMLIVSLSHLTRCKPVKQKTLIQTGLGPGVAKTSSLHHLPLSGDVSGAGAISLSAVATLHGHRCPTWGPLSCPLGNFNNQWHVQGHLAASLATSVASAAGGLITCPSRSCCTSKPGFMFHHNKRTTANKKHLREVLLVSAGGTCSCPSAGQCWPLLPETKIMKNHLQQSSCNTTQV